MELHPKIGLVIETDFNIEMLGECLSAFQGDGRIPRCSKNYLRKQVMLTGLVP